MAFEIEINSVSELLDYLKDIEELSKLFRFFYVGNPEDFSENAKMQTKALELKYMAITLKIKLDGEERDIPTYDLKKAADLINRLKKHDKDMEYKEILLSIAQSQYNQELNKKNKLNESVEKNPISDVYAKLQDYSSKQTLEIIEMIETVIINSKKQIMEDTEELKLIKNSLESELWGWYDKNKDEDFFKAYIDEANVHIDPNIKNAKSELKDEFLNHIIVMADVIRNTLKEEILKIEGNFKTFKNNLELFKAKKDVLVYRGQRNSNWHLYPSVFRLKEDSEDELIYNVCEHEFYKSVLEHNLPEFERQKCVFDRLALMQHYHIPTRLLDWTKNPLVALYFAVEECPEDGKVFVYCPYRIYSSTDFEVKLFCDLFEKHSNVVNVTDLKDIEFEGKKLIQYYNFDDEGTNGYFKSLLSGVLLIKPVITNNRLRVQQGFFSIHGFKFEQLNDNLGILNFEKITDHDLENSEEILATFIIPADKKKEIREELERLGIHDGTMFPELDKYGEYLKKKFSN
ncbi:FRG domain-containing protein [Methanococcus maripaludis]|uniref:FRG domain-containing protein n=1 Tax=Methanococcus maripaludis TaxID=39152 RepID=A0A8T4CK18_METMI|nr:FRG domain-containing protein [Methanococcus maripaludis]MBM7408372.1 hypothetical protein [Methanococcus maripaludis]MBP2220042.1 hypothetical protein [Methanococcus maripaludis]